MVDKNIPNWLEKQFSKADFAKVEAAIGQAELKTSGEIVPMIVKRSSFTAHISIIVFLVTWNLLILGDMLVHLLVDHTVSPGWLYIIYFLIAVVLSRFLSDLPGLQRKLLEVHDHDDQVLKRAENEFYKAGLQKTDGGTGVLIFLSMLEHRVVVLADRSISDKLPEDTWDQVVKDMITSIKNDNLASGLEKAILRCGDLLAPEFPRQKDNVNELRDHLIIKSD